MFNTLNQLLADIPLSGLLVVMLFLVNFSPLLTRYVINSIGPWNEKLTVNEELEYHIRFYCEGFKFCYVNYESGLYRKHDGVRLNQNNSFKNLYYYFTHVEKLLRASGLWTHNIGVAMSNQMLFEREV